MRTGTSMWLKPWKAIVEIDDAQCLQQNRLRCYIRLLIGVWGKIITRSALDGGLILMLNDDLRQPLLNHQPHPNTSDRDGVALEGLNYVLQELETAGQIQLDNAHIQQRLKLTRPFEDSVSEADRNRLNEVRQFFEEQRQRGKVVEQRDIKCSDPCHPS